jgi:hypothetical protein
VAIVTKPHGAATNKYEDNFGFYDLDADPNEAAFFAFIKAESGPAKCLHSVPQARPELCARRGPRKG